MPKLSISLKKQPNKGIPEHRTTSGSCTDRQRRREKSGSSAQLVRKAAAAGNQYGLYNMGRVYTYGLGVPIDAAKGTEYYQKAAKAGSADAQAELKKQK